MRVSGDLSRLDQELAALALQEAALRLRLGQALEVLGRGGHFELGFSSLGAYALERCERSVRWVEAARCLARRLEALPALRRAVAFGSVSWSMGEVLVGAAQPGDEAAWLETAKGRTVRELRALVSGAQWKALEQIGGADTNDGDESDALCTLTCTVDEEDAWLFESTRTLLEQLGTCGAEEQLEALLAEGQGALLAAVPRGAVDLEDVEWAGEPQRLWRDQLARFRAEAEQRCEERIRSTLARGRERAESAVARAAAVGCGELELRSAVELDGVVRDLSRALASHELVLSQLLLRFHRSEGWRRLGYATETQYARERLGMSRSSMMARRGLGSRLEGLPRVGEALRRAQIGVEAAIQIVRVATPSTELAWVERAGQRTIKHLREEVAATRVALRVSGEFDCLPPAEGELCAFQELERAVVSGRAQAMGGAESLQCGSIAEVCGAGESTAKETPRARRAWRVMLSSLYAWLVGGLRAGGVRMSAGAQQTGGVPTSAGEQRLPALKIRRSAGRIELRWRVTRSIFAWWRALEARARRWLPCRTSFLSFLCQSVWRAWRHLLGAEVAYGHIYVRDCFRCTSPVCNRRDVTPHHLRFRSAGGGDEDTNLAAVCTWCHLFGVHGGRIRAAGTADHITWELGPRAQPCVVVDGRERRAA